MTLAPKCDCGHGLVRHPTRGACTRCACTWYHPNVRAVARKKRAPSEFARIYGSRARVEWVKSLPCIVTIAPCGGVIENAHTENGGMGRKADAETIAPCCTKHHKHLHQLGPESFETMYRLDLHAAAARTEVAWQQRCAGVAA